MPSEVPSHSDDRAKYPNGFTHVSVLCLRYSPETAMWKWIPLLDEAEELQHKSKSEVECLGCLSKKN